MCPSEPQTGSQEHTPCVEIVTASPQRHGSPWEAKVELFRLLPKSPLEDMESAFTKKVLPIIADGGIGKTELPTDGFQGRRPNK